MAIPARINLVTLGVSDLERSSRFYESLGWTRKGRAWEEHVRFFALDNLILGLFPRASLAEDAKLPDTAPGFGGITLAINLPSEQDVDAVFAAALKAGARPFKKPVKADWGGYSGYFGDPDGHPWEVAFNPSFPLDADGLAMVPD